MRPEDEAAAREILEAVRAGATAAPEEAPLPCPRCGGAETTRERTTDRASTVGAWAFAGTPIQQGSWHHQCATCGHRWD